MEKIIVQGYKALGLQYFFTAGPDEVKAWTIQVKITNVLTTISLSKTAAMHYETQTLLRFYAKKFVKLSTILQQLISRKITKPNCKVAKVTECGNYGNLLSRFFDKNFVNGRYANWYVLGYWL